MDNLDYEYLKSLPKLGQKVGMLETPAAWWASDDKAIGVARILDRLGTFTDTRQVIDFFESPYKWEHEIQDLIRDYEQEEARV